MNGWIYDAITSFGERSFLEACRESLLPRLSGEIIELGAGTGMNFPYYDRTARVRAIEPNRSMLARATRRASRSRACIDLLAGDDALLDQFSADAADYVVATLVICSVESPADTLQRIHRVLKPEGVLVTIEHVRGEGRFARLQDWLTPLWRRLCGNCHLNRVLEPNLRRAGFSDVRLKSRTIPKPMRKLVYGTAAKEPASFRQS